MAAPPPEPEPIVDTEIKVPLVDFKDVKIRDILIALAKSHGLNFWVDPEISAVGSVYLENVKLVDALQFIIERYDLIYEKNGNIISFHLKRPEEKIIPAVVHCDDDQLTINVKNLPISDFIAAIIDSCGSNLVLDQGATGNISGYIKDADFEQGLTAVLDANNLQMRRDGDIFYIAPFVSQEKRAKRGFGIKVEDDLVNLNVAGVDLRSLIEDLADKLGVDIFIYGEITGTVTASVKDLPSANAFDYILKGTNYTYRTDGDIYFFGSASMAEVNESKLLKLEHLKAESVLGLVPAALSSKVVLQVVVDHNGLMLFGPSGYVREVTDYITELDQPSPQILIEALVIDYTITDRSEFGIKMNNFGFGDSLSHGKTYYPEVDVHADGDDLNDDIQDLADRLSIKNVGKLPSSFFVRLNAMVQSGNANVQSRPQIATLNGHSAKIDVGTTQYYLLKTETTYGLGQQTPSSQVSEKFQTIEASMSLSVTPWVNSTGEIIVEVHPEFNTPQGAFDPDIPPTINHRVLDSTIRLKSGETIVLGGLIQTTENVTEDKFPILGDIPILGYLFRNRSKIKTKSELVIYLTPHVYYGSEGAVDVSKYLQD
ncbi:MAG: hypothetical protein GY839_02840 [candidate division Zixibacteria bacterium]|nr:hypothetical protein [candidate division Zixibacteria bacterium]